MAEGPGCGCNGGMLIDVDGSIGIGGRLGCCTGWGGGYLMGNVGSLKYWRFTRDGFTQPRSRNTWEIGLLLMVTRSTMLYFIARERQVVAWYSKKGDFLPCRRVSVM